MKRVNLPPVDAMYWLALLTASILGTTFGDFVSEDLSFTFAGAVLPLAAIFGVILWAEGRSSMRTVAWYWVAIVIFRSTATTLGDTISRTLGLGYGGVSVALAVALVVFLLITSRQAAGGFTQVESGTRKVLKVDALYWGALLLASVFGTTFGDYVSDDTGLGFGLASVLVGGVLLVAVILDLRARKASDFRYWGIVALVRTAGTTMGDYVSEGTPHLGFGHAAIVAALALVMVLGLRSQTAERLAGP
jgi:uncharacterized membrane-anchored protein